MVRAELISVRLEKLRGYIKTLKRIRQYSSEKFISDPLIHGAAERYLQLAIESLLDIGNHIISDRGFRKPDTYAEVLDILAENKVISRKLFRELQGMAAFRNILVHDYLKLDLDRVYVMLHEKLPYLEKLGIVYGRLL